MLAEPKARACPRDCMDPGAQSLFPLALLTHRGKVSPLTLPLRLGSQGSLECTPMLPCSREQSGGERSLPGTQTLRLTSPRCFFLSQGRGLVEEGVRQVGADRHRRVIAVRLGSLSLQLNGGQ